MAPHLDNGIYDIVDRVMRPLALKQTRRPQSDHGKARHSVSSSSSHHHGMSSHQHDDADDDYQHCLAFNISAELRPELPDRNSTIKDSPEGKI
ncbi:hypothetical protein Tco_0546118, partial [Tanacetum coccineum]